jgi:hypothetical protein
VKTRYLRPLNELGDDGTIVLRGGPLESLLLLTDAARSLAVYGVGSISVLAPIDITVDELLQRPPLIRFAFVTVMTVGALRAIGLNVVPTGRDRHHYSIDLPALSEDVERLISAPHRATANPYYEW